MDFVRFEREFLRIAYTTNLDISAPAIAFLAGVSIDEARRHLSTLVDKGVLELDSDDDGNLVYTMPARPEEPIKLDDPALLGSPAWLATEALTVPGPHHLIIRHGVGSPSLVETRPTVGQAVAATFLNALVCPGVGSMVGGRTAVGLAQLALFAVSLPLVIFAVGIPLLVISWVWGMVTGAQLLAESRDP